MDIWDFLPFAVVVALLSIGVLGYVQSWLRHVFAWIKMRKDNYLASHSIDSIHTLIKFVTFGLYILAVIVSSIFLNPDMRWPFIYLGNYVFLFNGFVVLAFFVIMSILGSSAISNHRKSAEDEEGAVLKPGILEFYELFIKYGMLLLGFFIAIMVALITIPEGDVRNTIFSFIQSENLDTAKLGTDFLSLIIILLSIYLLTKFVDIILDDFKSRSKKFQPGIIDVIKAIIRYSLYWIALIITLTIILEMIDFRQLDLVIIFIIALTISIIIIIGVSPATKNAICGLVLLITDSINRGDWVQIGGDNVGEVVCQGLVITSLKTRTGDIIDLPNDLILSSYIHNFTKLGGTKIRLAISINTTLSSERVEEILLKIADGLDQSSLVTSERATLTVSMTDIRAGSVEYTIGIWRKDPITTEETISEFLKRFHKAAPENNITVIGTRIKH
ncbi:MAG: mechanosensitive ion channel family protein [Candidatus Thermoplasmatota archaeon]|nr:mechanosensitive ion channel [Euryarchaeota archaeon]MBU4032336.1 mechanosensitive ion channel family protein [Candidatus Thermoplasmatota archaeon]MBU4071758.1 mechanosensitive ion channel family protein [Candidatus Thermoplasmatota archaeon]MBU4144918.1 mechanosensitive ion channel family protein [Candidatus Thermoplasmatota archaeon]MBU4592526.1 mechanosensitive ion channel family protein [Candidatus Thermoplasmatota archaeon]